MRKFCTLMVLLYAGKMTAQTLGFSVPVDHPRLWWTTERLELAKTWYGTHPFTPSSSDSFGNAFRYVLTGESAYARKAIDLIINLELPPGQVLPTAIGCDYCRWEGENAVIVFDWCYDQMNEGERTLLMNRWNKYLEDVNMQTWGGIGMEGNNYYWGNLRNSMEWGIASFHHNNKAQSFLEHGLLDRWRNSFIPYAATGEAKGGAPAEGPEYGSTMLHYPLIPFVSAGALGRNMLEESNFYKEALVNIIYSTTPSPIINGSESYYGFFPYNETAVDDLLHERIYYGDFMMVLANQWSNRALGQYARTWITQCKPEISKFVKAVDTPNEEKAFTELPLDYYASGLGILYGRTEWSTNATAFQAQMKDAEKVGHAHLDWGSFQLFRKGRWITRESSGYSNSLKGVNNDVVQSEYPDAHNTIFVGVQGDMKSLVGYWQTAPPTVTRLESRTDYTFAAVDLSDCFQSEEKPENFENPFLDKVVREYVFIRPLETLLIFDRILSKNDEVPANEVIKTALFHFETQPIIENENNVKVTVGNQVGRLTTLVPSLPSYQTVNEGGNGQYRLQVSTSNQAQSYLLNVLQARDASEPNITASVIEDASAFHVTLTHPIKGNVAINFEKGASSQGGGFAFSSTTMPNNLIPFTDAVETVSVTDDGPVWGADRITGVIDDMEMSVEEQIMIYPNPASSLVTIEFKEFNDTYRNSTVSIYDVMGKLVAKLNGMSNNNGQRILWNTTNLVGGIYFISIDSPNGKISKRIVLN